jgi:hypothetical protein
LFVLLLDGAIVSGAMRAMVLFICVYLDTRARIASALKFVC